MAIVHPISRLFRSVTIASLAVAGPMALGLGSASAGEAVTEIEASSGTTLDGPAAALQIDGIEFGLGALAQMKRERSGASSSNDLRLELCWSIPIGR